MTQAHLSGRIWSIVALLTLASTTAGAQTALSVVSIPPAEQSLTTILADRPEMVSGASKDLEGPVFLPNGDLLFSDVQGKRVLRRDGAGRITTLATLDGLMPGGMALGPDGDVYMAAGNERGGGAVLAMRPDGTGLRTIVPESAGYTPNDLVFDPQGGFYFTDARGTVGSALGGVWYVSAQRAAPQAVVRNLAVANGIALSPDGKVLWIGEFAAGRLLRVELQDATTPVPYGATTAYHFIGPAPDSMRTDPSGRVHVALYEQGRILIFAPSGLPVAQILLPGRDAGRNLHVTSMAIRAGTRDIAIVTSDGTPGGHATIFHAQALAN